MEKGLDIDGTLKKVKWEDRIRLKEEKFVKIDENGWEEWYCIDKKKVIEYLKEKEKI